MNAMTRIPVALRIAVALSSTGFLGACDIFGVTSPGRIRDKDLNSVQVMEALVTGMSSDFSTALDDMTFLVARASDEVTASGSYFLTSLLRRGIIDRDDVDGHWELAQRARWVAENGLERMRMVLDTAFPGNPLTARAFFFAGASNRMLGECMCEAVLDGGPAQSNTVHFQRAVAWLDSAAAHAVLAGADLSTINTRLDTLLVAIYGVRAQAHAGLGDWAAAIADAAQVPIGFVFSAAFSDNSGRENNVIFAETWNRPEISAYNVLASATTDPRAPWTNCDVSPTPCRSRKGADGLTPHYRQDKYRNLGADIPIVKGTEMRLIEAEERLVAGDFGGAMTKINEVRMFHGVGLLSAADSAEAFGHLDDERHLTLWLEARRLFDLRRWSHPFLDGGTTYPSVTPANPRASCVPISLSECQTNPSLSCL